jgi:hypothetical protein
MVEGPGELFLPQKGAAEQKNENNRWPILLLGILLISGQKRLHLHHTKKHMKICSFQHLRRSVKMYGLSFSV